MNQNTSNRLWALGSAVLVVAIVAMGWFLGISPKLSEASTADEQRVTAETQNIAQAAEVAKIKKQYEQLPALKQQLAVLRGAMPTDDELSTFLGELHKLEQTNGVTLISVETKDALPYTPVDKPFTTVSTTNPLVTPENFVAIPMTLNVTGAPDRVMDFVQGVQTGDRLFLVTALNLAEDETGDAYSAKVEGYVYVLLDKPLAAPKTVDAAEAPKG